MTDVGQIERNTQNRVVKLFKEQLGYEYLGNWEYRSRNSNVEEKQLHKYLNRQGYSKPLIDKAIFQLTKDAQTQAESLYDANKKVYEKLRYGVEVREEQGQMKETVKFIDWGHPENNHFGIAEEVTVQGEHEKRPDLVLYVNGIAVGVIELKRSKVSVEEGIRQNLDNQRAEFIQSFFNTMQLVMAGNDSAGLRYGTIETKDRYYQEWKEPCDKAFDYKLDRQLMQLCGKERLIEIMHDFVLFDGGNKIISRPHQYFGVKATQQHISDRQDGIIWHTQGSGKSLTMVWLARWIREHITDSRVVVITDRTELDQQITRVFNDANEQMEQATSGADLLEKLNSHDTPLISSLVHKFGARSEKEDMESYINDIKQQLPSNFAPKGDIFVFVDECHRTQSGKLHEAMKIILPGAMFMGFTGTPLLKKDKKTSLEVFGPYIHTYKFNEAVEDNVVLDLRYEARDIEQKITDQESIDQWFEAETKGLNDYAKMKLKKRWGTLKNVLSSRSRLDKVVTDIYKDFETEPRLKSGRGNAMLVASSIAQACKYYELFQQTDLQGHCAVVTSFEPNINDIKGESTGQGETEEQLKYRVYTDMLDGKTTQEFEEEAKRKFVDEPARMKLLIVVDKLLTGFDAPPATYLYVDKSMQDHGLFQAICRVNRIDESKRYGYIIDYMDLFESLEESIGTYTSGAFEGYDEEDVEGLLTDRYEQARKDLDEALDKVEALCEPVQPRSLKEFKTFFGTDTEGKAEKQVKTDKEKRVSFYKMVSTLVRSYGEIANEINQAGYSPQEAADIKEKVNFYSDLKEDIKMASGDHIDLKTYEPGMRNLIDMYVDADHSKTVSTLDDATLVDLIVNKGISGLDEVVSDNIKNDKEAMAETIENNIRKVIVEERPGNPKYYDKMSALLKKLIDERKKEKKKYVKYLKKLEELARKVKRTDGQQKYPTALKTQGQKALYDNLNEDKDLALSVDQAVRNVAQDGWRNNIIKERKVEYSVKDELPDDISIDEVLDLIKNQHEY